MEALRGRLSDESMALMEQLAAAQGETVEMLAASLRRDLDRLTSSAPFPLSQPPLSSQPEPTPGYTQDGEPPMKRARLEPASEPVPEGDEHYYTLEPLNLKSGRGTGKAKVVRVCSDCIFVCGLRNVNFSIPFANIALVRKEGRVEESSCAHFFF